MTKDKKVSIVESVLATVFLGLLVYAAYSLWFIFYGTDSGGDVHLYTVMSGTALGWFAYLFVKAVTKKGGWIKIVLSLLFGNAVFHGVIWGLNSRLNASCTDNAAVVIRTFTVAFIMSVIFLVIAFAVRATKCKAVNIILAVVYTGVCMGCLYNFNAENIRAIEYKRNIQFDTITADEMKLTDGEMSLSAQWYEENFFDADGNYPFSFKVDGIDFADLEWEKSVISPDKSKAPYQGGKTEYLVLKNAEQALEVTVEVTLFRENATCQWKVLIKNIGNENSGVISDFYAFDSSLPTGKAQLYYSMGSNTGASDFSLIKKTLSSAERVFSGSEGKPTEKYLPYFNISGETAGYILGIGWTGQWYADFSQQDGETQVSVKQESFNAYLLPGEEVRSPLVSVGFYDNSNPLKGFNLFRDWVSACVYPENVTKNHYTVMEVAGPVSERTSDEIIEILDSTDKSVYENIEAFWMDAGWYSYTEGWHDGVGNWTADTSRYDNGIIELSDYARSKGLGHVLWYEPERVYPDTLFHKKASENEQWLIDIGDSNCMWNLADEEAFSYYCETLLASLRENGVTVYRQDFNFAPLEYWQRADAEFYGGRTGICENHYVSNLYRYLDYLTENIDGLVIDNCASGGKRLDLEMTYRSIAFWRSDYNCAYHSDLFEATQSHNYGISFWLPITGSALYMQDEYAMRSDIMPLMLMDFFSHTHPEFGYYHEQRELMTGKYYPIDFGSFDKDKMHAMQFTTDDALAGEVLIYKRADVKKDEYTAVLNGLEESVTYEIYDYDAPDTVYTLTGEQLMTDGITIPLPDGEKAIILMFSGK